MNKNFVYFVRLSADARLVVQPTSCSASVPQSSAIFLSFSPHDDGSPIRPRNAFDGSFAMHGFAWLNLCILTSYLVPKSEPKCACARTDYSHIVLWKFIVVEPGMFSSSCGAFLREICNRTSVHTFYPIFILYPVGRLKASTILLKLLHWNEYHCTVKIRMLFSLPICVGRLHADFSKQWK